MMRGASVRSVAEGATAAGTTMFTVLVRMDGTVTPWGEPGAVNCTDDNTSFTSANVVSLSTVDTALSVALDGSGVCDTALTEARSDTAAARSVLFTSALVTAEQLRSAGSASAILFVAAQTELIAAAAEGDGLGDGLAAELSDSPR